MTGLTNATAYTFRVAATNAAAESVAYVGDDLLDLPVLKACGLSFAPSDAVPEVRERVDVVLEAPGGRGAVRELIRRVLTARGTWDSIVERFESS